MSPTNDTIMPVYSHKFKYGMRLLEFTRRYMEKWS